MLAEDIKYGHEGDGQKRRGKHAAKHHRTNCPLAGSTVHFATNGREGYGLLAAAPLLGFSYSLLWPAFLTLPFAALQIFWLRNIALGARPIWSMLSANAVSIFGLTAYFVMIAFWLH